MDTPLETLSMCLEGGCGLILGLRVLMNSGSDFNNGDQMLLPKSIRPGQCFSDFDSPKNHPRILIQWV